MSTNIKNLILTAGLAVAVLITLNSFLIAGNETNTENNSPYYAAKDSLVQAIKAFDAFSDRYVDALTRMDQNSGYRYIGETNFLRSKIVDHEEGLASLLSEWQSASEITWAEDSTQIQNSISAFRSDGEEIEQETVTFLDKHSDVRR